MQRLDNIANSAAEAGLALGLSSSKGTALLTNTEKLIEAAKMQKRSLKVVALRLQIRQFPEVEQYLYYTGNRCLQQRGS